MLRVFRLLYFYYLLTFTALANATNQSSSKVLERNLLDKFLQNDYQLDFERIDLVRVNKEYVKFFNLVTFKYNRTCPAINVTFEYHHALGNDIEIIMQAYRFASNEYRLFPMRYQYNLCESIRKNVMGMGEYSACGNFTGCPIINNRLNHVCNWKPNGTNFPPLIPSGHYMEEFQGLHRSVELWLVNGYFTISRPIPIPEK